MQNVASVVTGNSTSSVDIIILLYSKYNIICIATSESLIL